MESSGYSPWMNKHFPKERYIDNTQWIHTIDNIIFSHAGISKKWMEYAKVNNVSEINNLDYKAFLFNGGSWDMYGTDPQQTPVWIRPETLVNVAVDDFTQVVGHTPQQNLNALKLRNNVKSKLWLCDALGSKQYLVIDNGEFIKRKFKQS